MKARVYGWVLNSNAELYFSDGEHFKVVVLTGENKEHNRITIRSLKDHYLYSCHIKQIEPLREVTITAEDFDHTFNLVLSKHKECGFTYDMRNLLNEFKEELFKDKK